MNIVKRKLSELRPVERNIRMHPEKQMKEYVRSLEKNGQLKLLVIDENNVVWIGNGLYEAMLRAGYTEAYCQLKEGMSESAKKKMMLADNRIYSLGVDDIDNFDLIVRELDDFDVPGFDSELLETLTADLGDADDLMAGYGTIDESAKANMQKAADRYEQAADGYAQTSEEVKPAGVDAPVKERAVKLERHYIVCPKCGEKIWL